MLEATVSVAVLAIISAAGFAALLAAQQGASSPRMAGEVKSAQNSVKGAAAAQFRLPMPDDAIVSPGRPGYLEGWLPRNLEQPIGARTRYLVNATLVNAPSLAYQLDPANLLQGNSVARTGANGLDFCVALINQDLTGATFPGGHRLAYAVQRSSEGRTGQQISTRWVEESELGAGPMETLTIGYAELASDIGCFDAMASISAEVKAAAVHADLLNLAEEEVAIRAVAAAAAEQFLHLMRLRIAIWSTGLATATSNLAVAFAGYYVKTPASLVGSAMATTKNILNIVIMEEYTRNSIERLPVTEASWVAAVENLRLAELYRDTLNLELTGKLEQIRLMQEEGLK